LHILFYIVVILTCSLCNKNDDDDDHDEFFLQNLKWLVTNFHLCIKPPSQS